MVRTFTAEQKGERLTEHYTVGDFWAFDGHRKIKLDTVLAEIFEKMYAHFGTLPRLRDRDTAGYRDSLNWTGSKTSQHCYGKGADVWIPGVAAYRLAQFAETLPQVGGIGLYLPKSGGLEKITHIHVDTRSKRARWGWDHRTSGTNTPGFGGIPCMFKQGHRSAAIEDIQLHLNALGFACGAPDGVYGKNTRNGVMAFQQARGLKADGIYGRDTNAALGLFDWR